MISIIRVLYKNTPVMYDAESRFPKHILYLDQAEGLPNTPVLWCMCHLIEVPPLDQITRLLGEFIQPLCQETVNSDSDFEDSRTKKRQTKSNVPSGKDNRKGRHADQSTPSMSGSKGWRTVRKS